MFFLPFSKTTNCTWQPQWTHAILLHFKKNYLCLFTANCTQNHVIAYAYLLKLLAKLALILNTHTIYAEQAYLLTLAQIHNLSKQAVI